MKTKVVSIILVMLLPGCAATLNSKYKPKPAVPTAMVRLVAETNSTGTMGRHYNFFLSEDNSCAAGPMTSLGGKLIAEDRQVLPSTAIPAGQPITLVVQYREGRVGQMRSCGNVARFAPEEGHSYDVLFHVTSQGERCNISVQDAQLAPVSLQPSGDCYAQMGPGKSPIPNGRALVTDVKVQVQRHP
jgi:hypothetical protein